MRSRIRFTLDRDVKITIFRAREKRSSLEYFAGNKPATLLLFSIVVMAAQSFWDAAANLISITEKHPFLVSMVDGSLSYENFRYYVIQDALYLTDYANCLHMLGDKLSSIDVNKAKQLHQFAVGAEEDEKEMHRTFFKNWGEIDRTNVKAMPSTREFLCNYYIFTVNTQAQTFKSLPHMPHFLH